MKGSYLVYKFFAIFIVTILWNTSALGAAVQAVCEDRSLVDCEEDAQLKSVNGNEYRCCSCTISSGTVPLITYNCDKYADDGYKLSGSYCVKDTTSSEDERGYIETSYGKCLASSSITDTPTFNKMGSIMYLYKSSNGNFGAMPQNCALDFETTIK